jgi:tetratricopeptide (TPR) repeat protein
MQSMLPSLGAQAEAADASSGTPEFDAAIEALQATRPLRDPRLIAAAKDLERGRVNEAKAALSKVMDQRARNPDAFNLMARIADCEGRHQEAELLLARCVQSSPSIDLYRYNYTLALEKLGKLDNAIAETELLLEHSPRNPVFRNLKASLLARTGNHCEAVSWYRGLAEDCPESSYIWNKLGAALRDLGGRQDECRTAFLKAAELAPACGRIWWNLSNLKLFRFSDEQITRMEAALSERAISPKDRAELHFALGKAYDDARDYQRAFEHYSKANALRRVGVSYDPDSTSAMIAQTEAAFTPEIFTKRFGAGCSSREPIFVVGMQRSGSTLIEQILASHSQVEGLGELNLILTLVAEEIRPKCAGGYPKGVERLDPADLRAIGEKYLEYTKQRRRTDKPFFVDKCPYNFWHVGLIRLILPNARIIDARRHPMACCFANFSTNFSFRPPLSYKQTDIGRFYVDYVRLMACFDRVQPGKIHRAIYEKLVDDLETEVRRMLAYLELPFEESCLEFYRNERSLDSLSSEQVRSPIFKEGVDRWRNYEQWLGPMKTALEPVLDAYPVSPSPPRNG